MNARVNERGPRILGIDAAELATDVRPDRRIANADCKCIRLNCPDSRSATSPITRSISSSDRGLLDH